MLKKWASNYAISIWNRLKDTKTHSWLKISETTITQNMVYELFLLDLKNIIIEEAKDEATNGNDLEVYIQDHYTNKFKRFTVQSKKSNNNEIYQNITHKKNNSYQILDLISYSRQIAAIPLYFFYSYTDKYNGKDLHPKGFPYDEYGIIIIRANIIFRDYFNWNPEIWKFKKIPSVCEIIENQYSFTFCEFLCDPYSYDKIENCYSEPIAYAGEYPKINYNFDWEEIICDKKWKKIKDSTKIIDIKNGPGNSSFNPKYRIIIKYS